MTAEQRAEMIDDIIRMLKEMKSESNSKTCK